MNAKRLAHCTSMDAYLDAVADALSFDQCFVSPGNSTLVMTSADDPGVCPVCQVVPAYECGQDERGAWVKKVCATCGRDFGGLGWLWK